LPADTPSRGDILIEGSVLKPGLYPYSGTDTIDELIRAAGGTTDGADLSRIELRVTGAASAPTTQLIDVNRAEAWLLEALPGIGEVRARAIVDHRERQGPFRSIDELTQVTGIGDVTLDRIRPLITVSD
jgi:competence protein ComEA